jgi:diguanylate cyclase (GGDEF)-like protein
MATLCSASIQAEYQSPKGKSFGVAQGLSQLSVLDIEQDSKGFIWLATQAGVDRFNGSEFAYIGTNTDLTKGLPANFVNRLLYDDKNDELFIATINGLTRLSLSDNTLTPISLVKLDGEAELNVLSMHFDNKHNLWIGTSKSLFVRPEGATTFNHIQIKEQLSINDIISLPNNDLLMATSSGVCLLPGEQYQLVKVMPEVKKAYRLLLDDEKRVWVGTDSQGVFVYEMDDAVNFVAAKKYDTQKGLAGDEINAFMQSADSNIWIGTSQGTSIIDGKSLSLLSSVHSSLGIDSTADTVNTYSFFESENGQIFVGTRNAGFSILDPNSTLLSRKRFGNAKGVENIVNRTADSFWVTTQKGVFSFDGWGKVEGPWNFTAEDLKVVGMNAISGLVYDADSETLWMSSRKGLASYQWGNEYIELYDFAGVRIYSIGLRSTGELWLGGAENGLFLYQPDTKQIIANWDMPLVTKILEVSPQEIWATTTGGLYRINLEQDTITRYGHDESDPNSLPLDGLGWISQKSDNEFYIGTLGRGPWLMTLRSNRFEVSFSPLSADPVLSGVSVGAVLEGNDGNLWVSTTSSILMVDQTTKRVTIFDKNDGANEGGYYVSAAAVDAKGSLYFAGLDGLTHFNPRELVINNYTPKMHIDGLNIVSRTKEASVATNIQQFSHLDIPEQVLLSPDDLMLNIDMIALEYADVPDLQYAYRVPEIDPSWQALEVGKRSATLMNLDPGDYSFEMKIRNRFLQWSGGELGLKITVLPSWWQTATANLVWVCVFILIILFLYKWRTYQFRKRSQLLEQQVQQQTIALKKANDSLTQLSMQDSLLDVFNRRGFLEWLEREDAKYKRSGKPYSILLLDVDHFKKVNDRFGHTSGDKALLHITDVLKKNVRGQDSIARWGGEEFIILLPYTDISDASVVAEKIRSAVENAPLMLNNITIHCTITLGIASIKDFDSFEDCVSHADMMLYKGKESGRNRVMF